MTEFDLKDLHESDEYYFVPMPRCLFYFGKPGYEENTVQANNGMFVRRSWAENITPLHEGCSYFDLSVYTGEFNEAYGDNDENEEVSEACSEYLKMRENGTVKNVFEFARMFGHKITISVK